METALLSSPTTFWNLIIDVPVFLKLFKEYNVCISLSYQFVLLFITITISFCSFINDVRTHLLIRLFYPTPPGFTMITGDTSARSLLSIITWQACLKTRRQSRRISEREHAWTIPFKKYKQTAVTSQPTLPDTGDVNHDFSAVGGDRVPAPPRYFIAQKVWHCSCCRDVRRRVRHGSDVVLHLPSLVPPSLKTFCSSKYVFTISWAGKKACRAVGYCADLPRTHWLPLPLHFIQLPSATFSRTFPKKCLHGMYVLWSENLMCFFFGV